MCLLKIFSVTIIVFLFFGQMDAKPFQLISRQKRTSDQRLAELETLLALSKMNGKLVTIPIGFGKVDPNKIGRRRRSLTLLQQLINDLSTEDKRSDEFYSNAERREEDGGEEKEDETSRKDQLQRLSETLSLKTFPDVIPIRLLE